MQEQLDQFEKRLADDQKKITALEGQTKLLREEMEQAKVLFQDMGNTILADSKKIEGLSQQMGQRSSSKPVPKPIKSSPTKPKRR